jgi:hypothetical protein
MEVPMNRILPLLFAASIPIALCVPKAGANNKTAAPPYRAKLSGEQLVNDVRADLSIGHNPFARGRAMGYIAGVMDLAAGRQWCPAGKIVPHELDYLVVEDIEGLRPEDRTRDASALIVASLAKKYPCATGGKP